jgi:hypothetical protein
MQKNILIKTICLLAIFLTTACVSGKGKYDLTVTPKSNPAETLLISGNGTVRDFDFGKRYSGTIDETGWSAGLGYTQGKNNVAFTIDGPKTWNLKCSSVRRAVGGVNVTHEDFMCSTVEKGRKIGTVSIKPKTLDAAEIATNYVWSGNTKLSGKTNIKGVRLNISSVYRKEGESKDAMLPLGYKISKGKRTLGLIQIDRKPFPMKTSYSVWLKNGLGKTTEEVAFTGLVVSAFAK